MPLKIDGAYGAIKPVLWAVERPDQLVRVPFFHAQSPGLTNITVLN